MGAGERAGFEMTHMHAAVDFTAYQPGSFEHFDVLRCRRQGNGKRFGKLTDRLLASAECAKHSPAGGIAERMKDGIQLGYA